MLTQTISALMLGVIVIEPPGRAVYERIPEKSVHVYPDPVKTITVTVSASEGHEVVDLVFRTDDRQFRVCLVGPEVWKVLKGKAPQHLARYVLVSQYGALEFVDKRSKAGYLPFAIRLQPALFAPQCLGSLYKFKERATYLGEPFRLTEIDPKGSPDPLPSTRVIRLNDDLFVGTPRNFRDVGSGRIPLHKFRFDRKRKLDYTYRELRAEDLSRMIDAGMNYFDRIDPVQLPVLVDRPVFFDMGTFQGTPSPLFPDIFYHSGFLGCEDFFDEPAYIEWEDSWGLHINGGLAGMARRQERSTRNLILRKSRGRMPGIITHLEEASIGLKGIEIKEPPLPIWEEFYSTACYQLRNESAGFIHEGRYMHPEVVDLLNDTFHTSLPRKPSTMFKFYFAFLRGSARVFDKDWGTSIYGQADPDVSLEAITTAYDWGARYIFFWTSDRDHHLPFEEQLKLSRELRDYIASHPRSSRAELRERAATAIVLPYGFTFSVSDWDKSRVADLWHRSQFDLVKGETGTGVPYYSILRCAAEKMEELIRKDEAFDIVVDIPELSRAGYRDLYDPVPDAMKRRDKYPAWIHMRRYILVGLPVLFLICYRAYRIRRWLVGRRLSAMSETGHRKA